MYNRILIGREGGIVSFYNREKIANLAQVSVGRTRRNHLWSSMKLIAMRLLKLAQWQAAQLLAYQP